MNTQCINNWNEKYIVYRMTRTAEQYYQLVVQNLLLDTTLLFFLGSFSVWARNTYQGSVFMLWSEGVLSASLHGRGLYTCTCIVQLLSALSYID